MTLLASLAVALVAVLNVGFLVLEMFLWTKPIGRRVFGLPPEVMTAAAPLAANQGLYNGFLAAGLLWGLFLGSDGHAVRLFFLGFVLVAGGFGAATAKRSSSGSRASRRPSPSPWSSSRGARGPE